MEHILSILLMILITVGILSMCYRDWKKYKRRDKAVEIKDMIAGAASKENHFNQFRKKEDD